MDRLEARVPTLLTGIALAVLLVFLATACSIGESNDGDAAVGPAESEYAQCLRENGAAPPADSEDFDSDGLAAAQAACADLLPDGAPGGGFGGGEFAQPGGGAPGAVPTPEQITELVDCLRGQGIEVPDDPTQLPGTLDPSDPEAREALGACLGGGPFGP